MVVVSVAPRGRKTGTNCGAKRSDRRRAEGEGEEEEREAINVIGDGEEEEEVL